MPALPPPAAVVVVDPPPPPPGVVVAVAPAVPPAAPPVAAPPNPGGMLRRNMREVSPTVSLACASALMFTVSMTTSRGRPVSRLTKSSTWK